MNFKSTIDSPKVELLPVGRFEGNITVIESLDKEFFTAVESLGKEEILGFDTETKPSFTANSKRSGVALLQLSTSKEAFLFRLFKLGLPSQLLEILSSKKIVKVGVAVHDDIKGLQRISHFNANSFVDLQSIIEEWGIKEKSLVKMAAIVIGEKISKSQRLSNWEAESLTPAQLSYAATDAYAPLKIYRKLLRSG
ncbi:MAG: 3'-5' exonuclease [Bacteroidales bacterium]